MAISSRTHWLLLLGLVALSAAATVPRQFPTSPSSGGESTSGSDSSSSGGGMSLTPGLLAEFALIGRLKEAHGIMGTLAFAFFFPVGGIMIRAARGRAVVRVHAAWQVFALLLALATMGIGIYMARELQYLMTHHAIIGLVAICGVSLQPLTGQMHHVLFKRTQGRTAWSYAHIGWGIPIVTLGAINGGLGLQLGRVARRYCIVYGCLAAAVWLCWMVVSFRAQASRARTVKGEAAGGDKKMGRKEKRWAEEVTSTDGRVSS